VDHERNDLQLFTVQDLEKSTELWKRSGRVLGVLRFFKHLESRVR
jgi:hypothetical protein